jgi:hypothetical protein
LVALRSSGGGSGRRARPGGHLFFVEDDPVGLAVARRICAECPVISVLRRQRAPEDEGQVVSLRSKQPETLT